MAAARWYYRKFDLVSIKGIHRRYGELPMKHLPALGMWQSAWYKMRYRMQDIKLLDLIDYRKQEAKQLLMLELSLARLWRQALRVDLHAVLPRLHPPAKVRHRQRKAHLSNLILSGQMT